MTHKTCAQCGAPLDQCTPGCKACYHRHYYRACNKKTPARDLKAARQHAATLAAHQAWVQARRQRIAKTNPKPRPKPAYEPIYTEAEAATYTGLSRHTIAIARQKGLLDPDPSLTELAGHTIYRRAELDRWMGARLLYKQITEALGGRTTPHAQAFATLWKSISERPADQLEAIQDVRQRITDLHTPMTLTAREARALTAQLTKLLRGTDEIPLPQQRDALALLIRTALPTHDGNNRRKGLTAALTAWEQAIKQPH